MANTLTKTNGSLMASSLISKEVIREIDRLTSLGADKIKASRLVLGALGVRVND